MTDPTAFWLSWTDDPLALAGTGRRVGSLDDCRELILHRFAHARLEGPTPGDLGMARYRAWLRDDLVAIVREFPADFAESDRNRVVSERVDDVRRGKISREDYERSVDEAFGREWSWL